MQIVNESSIPKVIDKEVHRNINYSESPIRKAMNLSSALNSNKIEEVLKIVEQAAKHFEFNKVEENFKILNKQNQEDLISVVVKKMDNKQVKKLAEIFYSDAKTSINSSEEIYNSIRLYVDNFSKEKFKEANQNLQDVKKSLLKIAELDEKTNQIKNPAALIAVDIIFNRFYSPKLKDEVANKKQSFSAIKTRLSEEINHNRLSLLFDLADIKSDTKLEPETAMRFLNACAEKKASEAMHGDSALEIMRIFINHKGDIKDLMKEYEVKYLKVDPKEKTGLTAQKYFANEVFDVDYAYFQDSHVTEFLKLIYNDQLPQLEFMKKFYYLTKYSNWEEMYKLLDKPEISTEKGYQKIKVDYNFIKEIYENYYSSHYAKDIGEENFDNVLNRSKEERIKKISEGVSKIKSGSSLFDILRHSYGNTFSERMLEPFFNAPTLPPPLK